MSPNLRRFFRRLPYAFLLWTACGEVLLHLHAGNPQGLLNVWLAIAYSAILHPWPD